MEKIKRLKIQKTREKINTGLLQTIPIHKFYDTIEFVEYQINIDLSFFYFDLLGKKFDLKNSLKENENQKILLKQGIQVNLKGNTFVFLAYYKSVVKSQRTTAPLRFIILILLLKVLIPVLFLVYKKVKINIFVVVAITGFYIYISNAWFITLNNQDLKRRIQVLQNINQLIKFTQGEKNTFKVLGKHQHDNKLDITCPQSLETWDNMRRICQQLDVKNTQRIEISYIFLGLYYIFLILLCASLYGDFDFIISKESEYQDPIVLIHISIDFLLITLFFFIRIYDGDQFNNLYSDQQNLIQQIINAYDDLNCLYDIYFNEKSNIRSRMYENIIQKIQDRSIQCILEDKALNGKKFLNEKEFQIETITNNILNLKKIKSQIIQDYNFYQFKLFGIIPLGFFETLTTLVIGFISISPIIIKKIIDKFNEYQSEQ